MLDTVPLYCGEEVELDLKGTKVMLQGLVSLVSEKETLGAICWEAHLKHNKVVRATTRRTLQSIIGIARVQDLRAQPSTVTAQSNQFLYVRS